MVTNKKISIIGGSLAGLTTALCLLKEGYDVHVYEKAHQLEPKNIVLSLFPNAMRVMQHLGLYDELLEKGGVLNSIHVLKPSGKRLHTNKFDNYYPRPVCIRRFDLQQLLLEQFPRERYHTGYNFDYFDQKETTVTAYFRNGQMVESDLLIGADGTYSKVREVLLDDAEDLTYSGYTCWRGYTELDKTLINSETWGNDQKAVIINVGDNRIAWWFTAEEDPNTSDEPEGRRNKLLRIFKDWHAPIDELIASTDYITKQDVYDRTPKGGWYRGRVIIIGDAAHPCTPTTGHGGCAALEDAAVLSRCILKYENPTDAFQSFEKIRLPRIKSIVKDARILGAIGHWSNPLAVAFRNLVLQRNNKSKGFDINSYQKYFDYDVFEVEV